MPLIGGGGAGNVAGGSNPSGIGSSINYVRTPTGNFAYAYSGQLTLANATTLTPLEFTLGNETIISNIQVSVDVDTLSTTYLTLIAYVDSQVIIYDVDRRDLNIPQNDFKVVIPPYSHFKLTIAGGNDAPGAVTLTGEVH